MAQGDQLPAPYTYTEALAVYVDGQQGSDTTGAGTSGNPYKTLQKAFDILATSATWPGSGDLIVYARGATYGAASGQNTLKVQWPTAGKRPASTQRVVLKPWPGSEGSVRVVSPPGTDQNKYAIYLEGFDASFPADYTIFEGLDVDGESTRKGVNANGTHIGFYLNGTSGFTTNVEIRRCRIHGFYSVAASNAQAQALIAESGADSLLVTDTEIYDIGTRTGSIFNQEHGIYIQASNCWFHNMLIHRIPNGYSMQFFSGDGGTGSKVTHCTLAGGFASGIVVDQSVSNFIVKNCIIANHVGRGSSSQGIEFLGSTPGTGNVVDRVLYWNNTFGNRNLTPASGWTFTNERSGVRVHPMFAGADDYRLSSGSPAIGLADTSYSTAFDLDNVARVSGSEDAGCFEYRTQVRHDFTRFPPIGVR